VIYSEVDGMGDENGEMEGEGVEEEIKRMLLEGEREAVGVGECK
jgi:hypothetical protein